MLMYVGTRLGSQTFEDVNSGQGSRGQYTLNIEISDQCDVAEPRQAGEKIAHMVTVKGKATMAGYTFDGDSPPEDLSEDHMTFRFEADFETTFEALINQELTLETLLDDDAFKKLITAITQVGVVEQMQRVFDASRFRFIDIRRTAINCELVPQLCD